jgi:hypothetical protein
VSSGQTVLTLNQQGSIVANLAVALPAAESETGLSLGNATSAFGVNVSDQPGSNDSLGVLLHNADFDGNAPNDNATVNLHGGGSSIGVEADGVSNVNDVTIGGSVVNGILATSFSGSANVRVERVRSVATVPLTVNATSSTASASVRDALLQIRPGVTGSSGVQVVNPGHQAASFNGTGLTIEGGGSSAAGLGVANLDSSGSSNASGSLENSIVGETAQGPGHPVVLTGAGSGTANKTVGTIDYSDAPTSQDTATSGNSTLVDTNQNLNVDPSFVDPASDYHLQSGSPVIDAARAFVVNGGERDLDGNARALNGTAGSTTCPNNGGGEPCPDMGAYEHVASSAAPTLANIESSALSYAAGSSGLSVTDTLTVADSGSSTIAGATVKIASGYSTGDDFLGFSPQNGISGSFSNSTGTLTLSGTASLANYQTALRSITYSDGNASNPSTVKRTVTFQVDDGSSSSNTVSRDIAFAPPVANTHSPTITDPSNIVLHGDVNPEGLDTHYFFQYGPDLDHMPNDVPSAAGQDLPQKDHASHDVGYPLSVTPGQQVCFRLVATSSAGTTYANDVNGGKGLCITAGTYTAPDVHTTLPNAAASDHIDMTGLVNPEGIATTYYFQISTAPDVAGATSVPLSPASLGTMDPANQQVTQTAGGLQPGATYYYRLVASNAGGTTYGNIIHTSTSPVIDLRYGDHNNSYKSFATDPPSLPFAAGEIVPAIWSCAVDGHGTAVSKCAMAVTGPLSQNGDAAGTDGGATSLPTGCSGPGVCQYHVKIDAVSTTGAASSVSYSYEVNPSPSSGAGYRVIVDDTAHTDADTAQSIANDLNQGIVPFDLKYAIKDAGQIVGYYLNDGTIIGAGGGNIIGAGGGNIIGAGGGNLNPKWELVDPQTIIGAGGGNIFSGSNGQIIGAGGGNIVGAGGGNIVGAGGGNINPGSLGNIISKGTTGIISEAGAGIVGTNAGNIIGAGGGNIIGAGGGNIVGGGGGHKITVTAAAANDVILLNGTVAKLHDAPALVSNLASFGIGTFSTRITALPAGRHAHPVTVASGSIEFIRLGQIRTLMLRLTKPGVKLIAKITRQNIARHAHHKRPLTLKLRVQEQFKPRPGGGKPVNTSRTITSTPGAKVNGKHK